ncbi:MAG: hypothetical protein IJW36_03470 [Clostridia bacterium]|nr:hypothetical protein [Clostridia bacterium]
MADIEIGFGRRNLDFDEHWEGLDIKRYVVDRPIVLCLGGNGVIDKAKATRFCGTAERFVGLKKGSDYSSYNEIDLLGFIYTPKPNQPTIGEFNDQQRALIEDNIFMKLCVDEKGNPLPIEKVVKNFSLINVFTHCWGAREISMIGLNVERKMIKLGYSAQDIQQAFNQIFHVTYAPYTDHTCFPCLRVNSFVDSVHRELKEYYKRIFQDSLSGVSLQFDPPGYFRKSKNAMLKVPILSIYSSQLINIESNSNLRTLIDEHAVDLLERNFDWTQGHQSLNAKNADLVSKMASYAMAKAIALSIRNARTNVLLPKNNLEDLKEELESFKQDYSQEDLNPSIDF